MSRKISIVAALCFLLALGVVRIAVGQPQLSNQESERTPVKRAVLIGIDDYLANDKISDLNGAVNDVELVKSVLIGKFDFEPENVVSLTNSQATHKGIIDTIRAHLSQSKPGDVAFIHYSGHGSQMLDTNGDEEDRLDETIVPHDSRQGNVFDISDDQINSLMQEISAKTPNVVLILDSCHSGTAARALDAAGLERTARFVEADLRQPPASTTRALEGEEDIDDFRLPSANYVLISGSKSNELSNETRFNNVKHGALTYFLMSALQSAGAQATYRDMMEQTSSAVTAHFSDQHPQIEGVGIDTAVFGVKELLPQPHLLLYPSDQAGIATIAAGEVFGLGVDSEMDVFPPGTKIFDGSIPSIAKVRITQVEAFESKASILSGTIPPGARAVLKEIKSPNFQFRVFLDLPAGELSSKIKAGLADHDSILLLDTANEAQAIGRIEQVGETADFVLNNNSNAVIAKTALDNDDAISKVVSSIVHWARWHAVLSMRNPSPDIDFDFSVKRVEGSSRSGIGAEVPHGAEIEISLTNNSSQNIHPILLDLTDKGKIAVLYPPANTADPLPPGQTLTRKLTAGVPDGVDSVTDYIKAIVTTQPIQASAFRLNPLARSATPTPSPSTQSPLQSYIDQYASGQTRDLITVAVNGWATKQSVLRVFKSSAELDGFSAIFKDEESASLSASRLSSGGTRSICGANVGGSCYEINEIFDAPEMRAITPPRVRSGNNSVDSVGSAFDEAYDIMDDTGATRVEPMLQNDLPNSSSAPLPGDPSTRGLGGSEPIQRAKEDDTWSLKYANVPKAWEILRAAGKPTGDEAAGVIVAHPDTGYIQHAEIWGEPGERPLLPEKGYNYHNDNHDPRDIVDSAWLTNPSHGTGSSSAIISEAGCQLEGVTQCPTGIAQGAKLVPLRINSSVVNFNTKRLARALLDASGDDRTRVKVKTDLASIAMGGPPSWTLWNAVKKAEERGFIVVAAAGNYVRTVVWPARFKSVLSVAAINADCKPWIHSSRGKGVDIAAPGESVWRGTMNSKDLSEPITGMGTGTTYATSTTAGVVALWISKHKGSDDFERLKSEGKLTQRLIEMLAESSWRPGDEQLPDTVACAENAGWNSDKFGAGIVDAKKLLELPLIHAAQQDQATRSTERVTEVEQLPLWWSLYPDTSSLALAQSDYLRIFSTEAGVELKEVDHFESEIMYHYANDERLASLIDGLVGGNRSEANVVRIRQRLIELDISTRLRDQLV